jgi:formylglycine-generating enzyme required for sulfatase activity
MGDQQRLRDMDTRKILILSVNPKGTQPLRLAEEVREIKDGLQRSKYRDQYEVKTAEAVRVRDIHRAILDNEPNIVHFCGHGAREEGLVFEDEMGQEKLVSAEALAGLFELFANQVDCILLNACYSQVQAEAIAKYINHVIGMSQAIGDKASIEFAVGFYDALGAGKSVEFAYKLGCNTILRAGISENLTPQLLNKEALNTSIDLGHGITLEMLKIPRGSFLMGSTDGNDNEKPQHEVTIKSFYMGKYPVTQEQWRAIAKRLDLKINQDLDPNPAYFKDKADSDRRPVEQVSWDDAMEFCGRLSKLTGLDYRLPSEAEWEYACRAGTTTAYSFGEEINKELANYGNNIGKTTPVGKYPANQFGIYDMHGNVWEWCADYWHGNYENAPNDGRAWLAENGGNSAYRVLRGGSWDFNPTYCRSAFRLWFNPDYRLSSLGFRVVCRFPRL